MLKIRHGYCDPLTRSSRVFVGIYFRQAPQMLLSGMKHAVDSWQGRERFNDLELMRLEPPQNQTNLPGKKLPLL